MNNAHYHLIINHFPIIIPMIGAIVLIVGLLAKNSILKRTAYCLFVFGALFSYIASVTGEGAEEVVENMKQVSENLMHYHEEWAEKFALVNYLMAIISIVAGWISYKKKSDPLFITLILLFTCTVGIYLGIQTGNTGGQIMHTEIRDNATISTENNQTISNDKEAKEKNEDD
ncbi:MAG: hypothetical protein IPG85_03425 [Bacteroidetes bacterium]|nr:hypothetical protein [Bacteroidota bacterium]